MKVWTVFQLTSHSSLNQVLRSLLQPVRYKHDAMKPRNNLADKIKYFETVETGSTQPQETMLCSCVCPLHLKYFKNDKILFSLCKPPQSAVSEGLSAHLPSRPPAMKIPFRGGYCLVAVIQINLFPFPDSQTPKLEKSMLQLSNTYSKSAQGLM